MSEQFKELTIIPEDINILLLGENEIGKSTFIQAFANYMMHDQFTKAEKKVIHLSPSSFKIESSKVPRQNKSSQYSSSNIWMKPTYNEYEDETFSYDCNQQNKKSSCSYFFSLPKYGRRMHLIDTPGLKVDSKDLENNHEFENVLSYINKFKHLHAICFVLKPSSSISKLHLELHIKFLLSNLQKSASKNIIFLFTHSWNIDRSQENEVPLLREIFDQIRSAFPHADVKFGKENVFYVDNEAFNFLESSKAIASLSDMIWTNFVKIWNDSVAECRRMIEYILGKVESPKEMEPLNVKNTIMLYNSRQIITQLSRSLADIDDIIDHLENRNIVLTKGTWSDLTKESLEINNQKTCSASHCDYFMLTNYHNRNELEEARKLIESCKNEKTDYAKVKKSIVSNLQKFAVYVKDNAIIPCNDAYAAYIKYLIAQEIQNVDGNTNAQAMVKYHDALKQYTEETRIINMECTVSPLITTTDILDAIESLNDLKDIKEKFEDLHIGESN